LFWREEKEKKKKNGGEKKPVTPALHREGPPGISLPLYGEKKRKVQTG